MKHCDVSSTQRTFLIRNKKGHKLISCRVTCRTVALKLLYFMSKIFRSLFTNTRSRSSNCGQGLTSSGLLVLFEEGEVDMKRPLLFNLLLNI